MIIQKEEFTEWVESTRARTKENYIDTILLACSEFDVDVDLVQPLLSAPLILKVKAEAIQLKYFKTTTTSLEKFIS